MNRVVPVVRERTCFVCFLSGGFGFCFDDDTILLDRNFTSLLQHNPLRVGYHIFLSLCMCVLTQVFSYLKKVCNCEICLQVVWSIRACSQASLALLVCRYAGVT